MPFAEGTSVPVGRTRGEIETLAEKYGATRFASGWLDDTHAAISFAAKGRLVRFVLPLPTKDESKEAARKAQRHNWMTPAEAKVDQVHAGELRRRWRCLLLAIKAKMEVVETGIETFDQAFLANIVTDGNMTVYEAIMMRDSGVRMLPAMGDDEEGAE
jgi:hypothetical protein